MTTFIISVHVTACILLIIIILIQRGRGGGLAESFSGVESMFGTKTNALLSRTTTVLATVFFITCLTLAVLSVRQSRSLMRQVKPQKASGVEPASAPAATPSAPIQELPKAEEKVSAEQPQEMPKAE